MTASKDTQYLYKLSLSSFFAFEQIVKGPDKRYDTFFASILKEKVNDLPDNMSILSWNYDNQFEIAYSSYSKHDELQKARDAIRIITKSDNSSFNHPSNKFHIIKLNGTTALLGPGGNSSFFLHDKCFDRAREFSYDDLMMITNSFKRYVTNTEMMPSLSFAWEQNVDYQYSILFKAVESVEHISTLVIIGYSFPFFNRGIDRGIFDSMRALTKIYIQDPRANDIVQRVEELCNRKARQKKVEIVPYADTSQFLIPNELD
ncbi:hypothetical protein [Dyadobacter alkalitolerans]|uniref:hypothetical protein n=1 Tax=Dyadobacter alkalitolerans TaxID=492736 RepID=UPI00041746FD|nr:hypothetical protein [Dyadobacter alkalitolerans]